MATTTISEASISLTADTKGMKTGLDKAKDQVSKFENKIEKMLFKYFDVPFDKKYFRKHCTFFDFQKIFACIICLHEMIKKNAIFLLQKVHQINHQKPVLSSTSTKNMESHRSNSTTNHFWKSGSL